MKRIHILLGGLLVVTAIFATISLQTNTGPIRMVTKAVTRILPVNKQEDIATSRESSLSEQIDTTVRTSLYNPFGAQTEVALSPDQVGDEGSAAVSTAPVRVQTTPAKVQTTPAAIASPVSPGIAQATPAIKTAPVSPAGAQTGTTAKTGSGKGKSTVKIAKAILDSAQPNTAVKTVQVSKQDSTAVKTTPVSEQTNTAVKTPTVSEQTNIAVETQPVSTQPYSPETTSPATESALRTLYVDSISGNDTTGNGSSAKPWKTIKNAVTKLQPGDVLSVMGGIYRERFFISKSGTASNRITIGAFGNGEVIIDASPQIGEWTPYTETTIQGIYKATCSFKPTAVVVNEQPIFPAFSLTGIKENEWYYDSTTRDIYLYPTGAIKPTSSNVGVIADDEYGDAVTIGNVHYVTLYGLTVRYAGGRGISILGNYNEIRRCNVKFNGHTGITVWGYKATKSTDTIIAENNIYHNFLRNWPRGRYKWGGWGGGTSSQGTPNTQFIGNISHKNGGEGILAYGGSGGTVFKNNISFDNWSCNIYVDNQPNVIVDGNTVFCNEPNLHDLYHNGDKDTLDNKNLRRLRAEGIATGDEDYQRTPPANLNNVKITNNIISGCRRAIDHYAQALGSGLKNVLVSDNIIIVPDAKGPGEDLIGMLVPYNKGNNLNVVFEKNLIYATNPSTYLLYMGTDPAVTKASDITFKNITFKGNAWYHTTKANPFHVGPTYHTTYDIDFNKLQTICKANCIADKYKDITTQIKKVLDKLDEIIAANK